MKPDSYDLTGSEINHQLLTSIRNAIEQSNHQIELLSYELAETRSEISKILEKIDTDSTESRSILYSIEDKISEVSRGIDGMSENHRICTNDILSALMKTGPGNYHPWFLIITILIALGLML